MQDKYEVGVAEDGSYAFVRVADVPITQPFAIEFSTRLVQVGAERGVWSFLIDVRGTRSVSSDVEKYNFAYRRADDIKVPRSGDFALVKDPEDRSFDFLELVMANAGFQVAMFDDEQAAVEWLAARRDHPPRDARRSG